MNVTCDGCEWVEVVQLTATARRGWDERDVAAHLESVGWTTVGDEHYCDECSHRREEVAAMSEHEYHELNADSSDLDEKE